MKPINITSRRDNKIIQHVLRNSISTQAAIHKLFFPDCQADASRKVVDRLVKRGFLIRYPLYERQTYLRLGRRAITMWNYPRQRDRKLGAQSLPYELGTLAYMCLDAQPRKRLLRDELTRIFPWFPNNQMFWAYYLEQTDSTTRLMTVRVETRVRADRALQKIGEQVHSYSQFPEFARLIEDDQFGIVIITASPEQESAICNECESRNFPVQIRTAHFPPLIHFI